MKAKRLGALVAGVAALGAAAGALAAEDDIALGKQEYDAKCAVCHGPAGKGDGPFVSQLTAGSSDITVLAKNNDGQFPTARVLMALDGRAQVQAHGPREMPIWGSVYMSEAPGDQLPKEREGYIDERLRAVIAYVEALQEE